MDRRCRRRHRAPGARDGPRGSAAGRDDHGAVDRSDPDDWPFAGANGAAPALPYSRTGGNRVITAQAPDATPHGDDFDDLFNGTGSSDTLGQVPPRPNKRRRRIGGWIALAVVLMLFGGVAAGGLWVWNTYEAKIREFMGWEEPKDYAEGQANGEALVTIASGDNGNTISTSLYEAGVTKTPDAFYDMLVDTAQNPTFYPGVYTLQKQMTSAAALAALQDPGEQARQHRRHPRGTHRGRRPAADRRCHGHLHR